MFKKIILATALLVISGCANVGQPERMRSNATLEWADGLTERALVSGSKRSITVPFGDQVFVFLIDEQSIGKDCLVYSYKHVSGGVAQADICFGSEMTLFLNGQVLNSGNIYLDNGQTFTEVAQTREYAAKLKVQEQLKQEQDEKQKEQAAKALEQDLKAKELELFIIEQQKKRVIAETKAIETHSEKTDEKIDATNDLIRSVGKGIEEHGVN